MSSSSHYILYWNPGSVSIIVHWALRLLAPLGVTFELRRVKVWEGAGQDPEYLRLNPLGQVPTLVYDGDKSMTEGIAILLFLAERHPESPLGVPPTSPSRAEYLQTMVLLANSMLSAVRNYYYAHSDGDPAGQEWVRAMAEHRMSKGWDVLEKQLEGRKYVLGGEGPTMADLAIVCCARWGRKCTKSPLEWKNVRRLVDDLTGTKEWAEVCKTEGIPVWPMEAIENWTSSH